MKRLCLSIVIVLLLVQPVYAMDFSAPEAPQSAEKYMPEETSSFWEDLLSILQSAITELNPHIAEATSVCSCVVGVILLGTILNNFSDTTKKTAQLVITIAVGLLLLNSSNSLIELGRTTVQEISEYGKLILPVLTGALAAQGATATSAALYTGTALFSAVLSTAISKLLIPVLYLYLCVCIGNSAIGNETLSQIKSFLKWILTWGLKIILYVFTGYMSVTGVISGSVDASALKATKLTISGVVPVVGNILSDASETIILSAGVMKNSAGVYGVLVLISLLVGPFLRIGIQYLFLKITGAVCGVVAPKETTQLIADYSSGMGFVLAMTGTSCLLLMIGIVCMMKGVS